MLEQLRDTCLLRSEIYVNGRWARASAGRSFAVQNPATGELLGHATDAGPEEVAAAIESARAAFPAWSAAAPDERARILRCWADLMRQSQHDLALLMTLEQGKPLAEAHGEIEYAASFLDWFAEEGRRAYGESIPSHLARRRLFTVRQPIGVSAAITPWNFPSAMITRKAGAALAAGCPMIVRPADETPFSALALAVLAERAGVPDGVFSVLTGDARRIAGALTASPLVRALSFTGSTEVGRILLRQCADTVKRVSLELGGHAPFIVFADVDVDWAVNLAVRAKFQTSGQDCLAANRIYVARAVYADFIERFAAAAARLRVGNGLEPGVEIGPLISERAITRCEAQIAEALTHGARLVCGGKRHHAGRTFLEPTVLCDVTENMQIGTEETFGPVAALLPFDREDEVVARANASEFGLAAYLCTKDVGRALRVSEALECGMVAVNTERFTGPPIPFGGIKQSGLGREGSRHGLNEYLAIKYICLAVDAA